MTGRRDFIFNILYISVFTFVVKKNLGGGGGRGFPGPSSSYTTLTPLKKEENHRIKTLRPNEATLWNQVTKITFMLEALIIFICMV